MEEESGDDSMDEVERGSKKNKNKNKKKKKKTKA